MWEIIFGSLFGLLSILITYIISRQKVDHKDNKRRIDQLEEMNNKLIDQNNIILNKMNKDIKKILSNLEVKNEKINIVNKKIFNPDK